MPKNVVGGRFRVENTFAAKKFSENNGGGIAIWFGKFCNPVPKNFIGPFIILQKTILPKKAEYNIKILTKSGGKEGWVVLKLEKRVTKKKNSHCNSQPLFLLKIAE